MDGDEMGWDGTEQHRIGFNRLKRGGTNSNTSD